MRIFLAAVAMTVFLALSCTVATVELGNAQLSAQVAASFQTIDQSVPLIRAYDALGAPAWHGSGVALAKDKVLTAKHVVTGGASYSVILDGREATVVDVVRGSSDWALVTLDREIGLRPVQIAPEPKRFTRCYAVGHALALKSVTLTEGYTQDSEVIEGVRVLRISAPIIFGNSGGGVFTLRGGVPALIGISVAGLTANGQFVAHMALAVSLEDIRKEGGQI